MLSHSPYVRTIQKDELSIILIVRLYELKMNKLNHLIKNRIEELKNAKGFSWEKLAYSAGLSKSGLCQIKNEQNAPTISSLFKICLALGITPKDFFDFDYDINVFDSIE